MGHNLQKMVAEAIPFKIRNDFKTILRTSFVRFKQKGNNVLFWKLNQDSKPLDLKSPYFWNNKRNFVSSWKPKHLKDFNFKTRIDFNSFQNPSWTSKFIKSLSYFQTRFWKLPNGYPVAQQHGVNQVWTKP